MNDVNDDSLQRKKGRLTEDVGGCQVDEDASLERRPLVGSQDKVCWCQTVNQSS